MRNFEITVRNTVIALVLIISCSNGVKYIVPLSSVKFVCTNPPQVQNGFWQLDRMQCQFPKPCMSAAQFEQGTHLVYSCNSGFKISGSAHVYCGVVGNWLGTIPVCKEEVRCKDLNSASIHADCQYPGSGYVPCNSSSTGTVATLKCRNSYHANTTLPFSTTVTCNNSGQWVPEPMRCVPVPAISSSSVAPYVTSTYRPPSTSSRGDTIFILAPCSSPPQPENGSWKLDRYQCPSSENQCHAGRNFPPGTHLVYSCNSGFKISGSAHVYCSVGGKWLEEIPVCKEVHCKDPNSASIHADCQDSESGYVSCNSARTGTVATLKCRNSYHADTTLSLSTSVMCNGIGQWIPEPLRCVPVCGIVVTQTTPLIVNGIAAKAAEFPWHATLYKAENSTAKKEFICGGSIIQERLIITAAHCVYDETNNRNEDPSKYFVATGNVYRDYDSPFHDPNIVVKTAVKNFYVSPEFNGIHRSYGADIAIVEVTVPFVFSALLQPICMDNLNDLLLDAEMTGRIAGFGRTALGESSYLLQTIEVPYVTNAKCREASNTYGTQNYVTYDKFCAGYTNGSSVCQGDSGGGLVFKQNSLWYLKGIVSVSLGMKVVNGIRQCDSYTYSLYTRVSRHKTWIQCHIISEKTRNQLLMCRN